MATIESDVTEQITSEVDLFGSMMQQNVIEKEFNREYAPLATIQQGVAIEFTVKGANDLYLDLKHSRLHVLVKITKADGTNIEANTAAPINLTLHSMFCEIGLELNRRNVGDSSQLYPYRSDLETLLNFRKKIQETPLLSEGWTIKHQRAHGSHRNRWEQCRFEHSRHEIREKCRGRAHRSPSPRRFPEKAPYSSKYRFQHEIYSVPERLCV